MTEVTNETVAKKANWSRGLYMGLFFISGCIALALIISIALFQFLSTVITGTQNNNLLKLGKGLNSYCYQLFSYLTYNSNDKPYPFARWPEEVETTITAENMQTSSK